MRPPPSAPGGGGPGDAGGGRGAALGKHGRHGMAGLQPLKVGAEARSPRRRGALGARPCQAAEGGFDVCNEWPQKSPTTGPQNSPLARLGRCSSTCAMNGSGGPRLVASLMRRRKEPLRWRAALAPLLLCDKCNKVPVVPCGVCSRGATLLPCV